jgi:hypothetical protein
MTIATPSMVVIVVIMLPDAPNCALSHDFITVSNKSNFPIVIDMNVVYVMNIDAIYDTVNDITERVTVTMTITQNVATAVDAVLTTAC